MRQRTYGEGCAASHALDLVGDRWSLLVVRELLYGPKRFSDLRTGLPAVSTSVLTQRLTELETSGVLGRRRLPLPAAASVYELTEWGHKLKPVIAALGLWAFESPSFDPTRRLTPCSVALALESTFDPYSGAGRHGAVDLELDGEVFRFTLDGSALVVSGRSGDAAPDAVVSGPPEAIRPFLWDKKRVSKAALTRHGLDVRGDSRKAVELLAALCGTA